MANVRVLDCEIGYALTELIPAGSVSLFHLLFPDPWPKRRHHRRRIFTTQFVAAVHRALQRDGEFHVATDDSEYFRQMERNIAPHLFRARDWVPPFPPTLFEAKFVSQSRPIYRLMLEKTSPVT